MRVFTIRLVRVAWLARAKSNSVPALARAEPFSYELSVLTTFVALGLSPRILYSLYLVADHDQFRQGNQSRPAPSPPTSHRPDFQWSGFHAGGLCGFAEYDVIFRQGSPFAPRLPLSGFAVG